MIDENKKAIDNLAILGLHIGAQWIRTVCFT